ncbi:MULTISPECIES: glycosyltransferase family 4 protein [unclassified Dietzia]|uniref:glycosyltransferase family 4 protein n=1 Tax=unclassified Dietzia TaxID=2617939 RepID=UPI0015F964D9|nr:MULTISPECIES: glycosyltransferase family 4 protein [unclassified Dietzia]MBB1039788.1 glycosyltransferase family 4 protein [Dietzia sp. Cai40]MBB1043938.1 glycosyltransferase family 4 protein [Dietzia sp. DQ11-44]
MLSHWFDPEGGAAAGPGTIARALLRRGHEVDVLTGYPIYPAGRVFDGYRIRPYMREQISGVNVHRVPTYPSHDDNARRRMANYLSYAVTSAIAAPVLLRKADVVFVYSSPATVATAAGPLRALNGIPYVMQIQDLWPDTVTSSDFVNKSTKYTMEKALHAYCNEIYRRAAHIAVISPGMVDLLVDRGVSQHKVSVVPNWAEESSFRPAARDYELARTLGVTREFNVMYAGNLGEMQNLDSLIDAASLLRARRDIGFALVGDGVKRDQLTQRAEELGLDNVTFIPPQPFENMTDILALADAQLVTLKDLPLYRATMPSKIQANMAAGQAIIAAAAGDAAEVVRDASCGFTAPPNDPQALADAVAQMANLGPPAWVRFGESAYKYYQANFSEKTVGDSLEELLLQHRKHR